MGAAPLTLDDTRFQNSRMRSTRCSGGLPAISAALMAPIDTPATQCGSVGILAISS